MKALGKFFPVVVTVLFLMLHKVVLTSEFVNETPKGELQMKAIEQYFPIVLLIMLYKMVLTFESVNDTLKCDHSNETLA